MRFRAKKIRGTETLGERLEQYRVQAGLQSTDMAVRIGIPDRYVLALEQGNYPALPGDLYIRRFLERYAEILDLPVRRILEWYQHERRVTEDRKTSKEANRWFVRRRLPQTVITPQRLRAAGAGAIVVALLVYLGIQMQSMMEPPTLVVKPNADDVVIAEHSIMIQGVTDPEAKVTINGKEVVGTQEGHFQERIYLNRGVNVLEIRAKKKRSEPTTVYKKIRVTGQQNS